MNIFEMVAKGNQAIEAIEKNKIADIEEQKQLKAATKNQKLKLNDVLRSIYRKEPIDFDDEKLKQLDGLMFIVRRGISQHPDLASIAHKMDQMYSLPAKMQYDYLYAKIRQGNRSGGWAVAKKIKDVDMIMDLYNCSQIKALNISERLLDEEYDTLEAFYSQRGGIIK